MVKKKNKKDKNGLVVTYNDERKVIEEGDSWVYTDSLNLAEVLNAPHKEILRKIRMVLQEYNISTGDESPPVNQLEEYIYNNTDFTYGIKFYKDKKGELRPYYKLSKDLLILVMFKFKTDSAKQLQKLYIAKFNDMEKELNWYKARYLGMVTRNYMTDCIRDYFDMSKCKKNPYAGFTDLVYSTIYGHDTYNLRLMHGLPYKENIRLWLPDEEVKAVDKMEQEIGTLISYGLDLDKIKIMIGRKYKDNKFRNLKLLKEKRK